MCGRYTLRTPPAILTRLFDLAAAAPPLEPRFNIAPTQTAPVIRMNGQRRLALCRWGLIPSWAADKAIGDAFAQRPLGKRGHEAGVPRRLQAAPLPRPGRRVLRVAKTGGKKQPFYFCPRGERPFAFAGLWEAWHKGDQEIVSFTILTTAANELVRPLHDRMPVILAPENFAVWLDPHVQDAATLQPFLRPCPADSMTSYPVSTLVNSPRNDGPQCIERLA